MGETDSLLAFIFGFATTALILILIVIHPIEMFATLKALCDKKYGAGEWTSKIDDNDYWVCQKIASPICQVDGIGLEECQNQTAQG